ncbi:MAG: pyruvate kinase [Candidatus Saccharimonas sp.]
MNTIFKRTKILATLGPATSTPEKVTELIEAGTNGFRLNFSHGSHEERLEQIKWIREASAKSGRNVAVLQDLQGPKIRLGVLNDNRHDVKKGDEIILDFAAEHNGNVLPVQYNLAEKVKPGEPIYLFDGKVRTTVTAISSETAITLRVENDGFLMSRKGINLPDTDFGGDILTEKDLADITFGATQDYDYVALSFVQSEEDINNLRQILASHGSTAQIIAKIETKAAIKPETLAAIVRASDGIMVARGDLAVEAGAEVVPIVQRQIIGLCRKHGKLSIVATQMMASMVDAPEPTRAEVSDVATATIQGADVVMLSDETANGSYPVEAVSAMRKTILYTQENWPVSESETAIVGEDESKRNAIARAAVTIADEVGATAIIAETASGATAANIAKMRPHLPICVVTSNARAAQQLALTYATRSFVRPDGEKAGTELARELQAQHYFGDNEKMIAVIVSGRQPGLIGGTDTVRVRVIE